MSIQNNTRTSQLKSSRYCKDLLDLDEAIVCAVMVNESGQLEGIDWKKAKVPWETGDIKASEQFSKIIEEKLGTWMQIILSLSSETSPLIGGFERASFVHKNYQLVMLSSNSSKIVGIMVMRSADAEHIASKVKEIVG